MKFRILVGMAAVVAAVATAATGLVATASAAHATALVCTGGNFAMGQFTTISSGTYSSITVKGACNIELNAVIDVTGNIRVAPGGVLDAQSAPAVITVGHDVTAGPGSILGMGCQPSNTIGMFAGVPCVADPTGQTVITVKGNVTAGNADTVLLRKLTVGGNIALAGGGGDIPWSIKGNTVGGNITVSSVSADWLSVQFNTVSRNVVLHNITALDPGDPGRTVAVVENTVANNLICSGLEPGVSGGFIPGEVNHVGHQALGQCAALV